MAATVTDRALGDRSANNRAGGKRGERKPHSVVVAITAPAFVVTTVAVVIGLVAAAVKSMTSAPVIPVPASILNDLDILRRLSDLRGPHGNERF